ncbi:hypothetical protein [Marinomonas arenicola]|uniref:Uncharacterized protein n=1 Tax=Marinomonas arenicola TaxID=569601 RepID=A0ABU9GAE1_9GAMM
MYVYGEEQKKIIDEIVTGEGYSRNFINILNRICCLDGVRVEIDIEKNTGKFLFECLNDKPTEPEFSNSVKKQQNIVETLIKLLLTLEELDANKLAFFYMPFKESESSEILKFGWGAVNRKSFNISINDENLIKLLIKYMNFEIVPTPLLVNFHKNNYKSADEVRFNRQVSITWVAIAVPFIFGLVGVYFNITGARTTEEKIDKAINVIEVGVNRIEHSLLELKVPNMNYSSSIQKVNTNLNLIYKELAKFPKDDER